MESEVSLEEINRLKRLIYAANPREISNYLELSEYGPNKAEPEVRIAALGIKTSIFLLYQGLSSRIQGFDWDNDTIDPSNMSVGEPAIEIVDNAIDMIGHIKRKKAEAKQNQQQQPEPMEIDEFEVISLSDENDEDYIPDEEVTEGNDQDEEIDNDNDEDDIPGEEEEESYKTTRYETAGYAGNSTTEHYRFIQGRTDLKLQNVRLYFIPTHFLEGNHLIDRFKHDNNKGHVLDLVIAYSGYTRRSLMYNQLLKDHNFIYQATKSFEFHPEDPEEWWELISKFLLFHFILTLAHYKWKNLTIRALFPWKKNSLLSSISKSLWGKLKGYIERELKIVVENPKCVFCEKCNENCKYKDKLWHINLESFVDSKFEDDAKETNFLDMCNLYQATENDLWFDNLFVEARNFYEEDHEFNRQSVNKVFEFFEQYWPITRQTYYTYVLVLIDDDDDQGTKKNKTHIKELLETRDIYIYAGRTNQPNGYRREHFSDPKNEIYFIRTKRTRIFLARRCSSTDIRAIAFDEGFLLAFLMAYVHESLATSRKQKTYLINQALSSEHMHRCSKEKLLEIKHFIDSGQLLFNHNSTEATICEPGDCVGGWGLEEITAKFKTSKQTMQKAMQVSEEIRKRNVLKHKRSKVVKNLHETNPREFEVSSTSSDED